MTDRDLFMSRAQAARNDADEATLANVRDRCLRAEAAWLAMADRATKVDKMRTQQLADKAAAAERSAHAAETEPATTV
jgi:hypothetical protein